MDGLLHLGQHKGVFLIHFEVALCRALSPPWKSCSARLVRVNTELQIFPVSQAIEYFLNFTMQFCKLLFLCSEERKVQLLMYVRENVTAFCFYAIKRK